MSTTSTTVSLKKRSAKSIETTLDNLTDWLLSDSVSFTKIDRFRKDLRFDEEHFASLLGIAVQTYKRWSRTREVPLRRREFMCQNVMEILRAQSVSLGSLNPSKEALNSGFTTPLYRVIVTSSTTPNPTTRDNSLHLYIPLPKRVEAREEKLRQERIREIQTKHAPFPNDPGDTDLCECRLCQPELSKKPFSVPILEKTLRTNHEKITYIYANSPQE